MTTLPLAQHVGVRDVPWVDNPRFPGARQRLLQADVEAGISVMAGASRNRRRTKPISTSYSGRHAHRPCAQHQNKKPACAGFFFSSYQP